MKYPCDMRTEDIMNEINDAYAFMWNAPVGLPCGEADKISDRIEHLEYELRRRKQDPHVFNEETERCICGGQRVLFLRGDQNRNIGPGCSTARLVFDDYEGPEDSCSDPNGNQRVVDHSVIKNFHTMFMEHAGHCPWCGQNAE